MEAALAADPHLRSQAEILRRIRNEMQSADIGFSPGEFGLARLLRAIEEDRMRRTRRF